MTERKTLYQDRDGVRRTFVFDEEKPHAFGVHVEQSLDEILRGIDRDRELMTHGVNKLVARIPITVYERAVHENWDESDWRRWLNSSDAAPFRIWQGAI